MPSGPASTALSGGCGSPSGTASARVTGSTLVTVPAVMETAYRSLPAVTRSTGVGNATAGSAVNRAPSTRVTVFASRSDT
ncbi:hypothetical protein ACFQZ4_38600 [Catellatospora coxensis]